MISGIFCRRCGSAIVRSTGYRQDDHRPGAGVGDRRFVLPVKAADILSKWLGESEQRVKDLFARARARVPAIIFIDEIDAITGRSADADSAGDRARNAIVNVLLVGMDGLDSSTRVFVIGATNRPELLDEALLRPGRLGERIEIPLPDAAARKAMLELFSKKMRRAPTVDLETSRLRRKVPAAPS